MTNKLNNDAKNQTNLTDIKLIENLWLGIRDDYRTLIEVDENEIVVKQSDPDEEYDNE
jgi:hypothetical protein